MHIRPLHKFLTSVHEWARKWTERVEVHFLSGCPGWGMNELDALNACKRALANHVRCTRTEAGKRLWSFTDISENFRPGSVTEASRPDLQLDHKNKSYKQMQFLFGQITTLQLVWSSTLKMRDIRLWMRPATCVGSLRQWESLNLYTDQKPRHSFLIYSRSFHFLRKPLYSSLATRQ